MGGKNASLGELIGRLRDAGIRAPEGFATTTEAYWSYPLPRSLIAGKLATQRQSGRVCPSSVHPGPVTLNDPVTDLATIGDGTVRGNWLELEVGAP